MVNSSTCNVLTTTSTNNYVTGCSAVTFNITNETGVSPFCTSNAGTIRNCAVTSIPGNSNYNLSIFSPLAGICVTNTGTIDGCRCEGRMEVQSDKNFAGICLHNQSTGTISGCQAVSLSVRATGKASGICYENTASATVKDSYYAANITGSTAEWAGICYDNSGTVEHCYLSSTGNIYTTSNIGGIVGINRSGSTVDYCWVASQMRGVMPVTFLKVLFSEEALGNPQARAMSIWVALRWLIRYSSA